jgi:rubrerythrin
MQEFRSVNDILDFAISEEEAAAKFYTALAAKMTRDWMQKIFEGFADEEKGHKEKLLSVKTGNVALLTDEAVTDLKIGDYLIEVEPEVQGSEMDYQQALIMAMKKEKAAFKLYTDLAEQTEQQEYCHLFRALAQEEAKHKLRFEIEYDEQFLTEN